MTDEERSIEQLLLSGNETNIDLALTLMQSQNIPFNSEFLAYFKIMRIPEWHETRIKALLLQTRITYYSVHFCNLVKKLPITYIDAMHLKSLNGCPKKLVTLNIAHSNISTFKGIPNELTYLKASYTNITSLQYCPETILKTCDFRDNKELKSVSGCPKYVGEDFLIDSIKGIPDRILEEQIKELCDIKGELIIY